MKHKHADLIHAWADGAEIQMWKGSIGQWVDWSSPTWAETCEYRIKPEEKKPVVRWLWAYESAPTGDWRPSNFFYTDEEVAELAGKKVKLEWSRTEFPE